MQFIYYTEKTVAQALSALHERMQAKETSSRHGLDGWVEKNGSFSIGVTTTVWGRFTRTTYLRGKMERQNGVTVVKGNVNSGATRDNMIVIYGALAVVALSLVAMGSVSMALLVLPVAAALYIPLAGDYKNSDVLMTEIQRTLKAKTTPPKPTAPTKKTSETKPAAAKPPRPATKTAPAKPAAPSRATPKPAAPPAFASPLFETSEEGGD